MSAPETPVLDRMAAVQHESQAIGEFLAWLQEKGRCVAESTGRQVHMYWPISAGTEQLLAEYFEIDLVAAERERRAILADFTARVSA